MYAFGTFILMSFSPFHLFFSCSCVCVCAVVAIRLFHENSFSFFFRSFVAISLFSFAHYYHCDTMFVYFLSFAIAAAVAILLVHILLFYTRLFYCRFSVLSLSFTVYVCEKKRRRGHIKVCRHGI